MSPTKTGDASGAAAAAETFRRDGVVHLPGAFADWLDTLRAGVERNMREPGVYLREYEPEGARGYFFGDYCNWARIPEYRDFVLNSGAAALAARLMQSGTARFFHEHVLVKEPQTESRTPWHHDLPYYCIDGIQAVSFWTALDPVPREVCLELVAGSHRWGKSFMPRKFVGVDYRREGRSAGHHAGHRGAARRVRDRLVRRGAGRRHRLPLSHRPRRAGQRVAIGASPRLRPPLGGRRRALQGAPRRGLAAVPRSATNG